MRVSEARPDDARFISMAEAVGYPEIDCSHESAVESKLVLSHDRWFLLVDRHGDIAPPGACGLGLFREDTRFLSHYELRYHGGPAALLSAQVPRMHVAYVDLAVGDRAFGGDPWDPKNVIHIRRELLLEDRLYERITLTNYLSVPIDYEVELAVGCDFADIFEIRGWRRPDRGRFLEPRTGDRFIQAGYQGRDGAVLGSSIVFAKPPDVVHPRGARWRVHLPVQGEFTAEWQVLPEPVDDRNRRFSGGLEARRAPLEAAYRAWSARCARWSSDVAEFDHVLHHAVDDLRALHTRVDGEPVIAAGIPWYFTAFGRDSILTGLQTLALNPGIAKDTLRFLARHQGEKEDPFTEEQPGKILHEVRRGEMARAGEIPHVPYFGSVDATPLWLILLHETWRWTGDETLVRDLLPHAERALAWIEDHGDLDGDGFVEYARTSDKGLVNQGWKDSGDGVPFPDGSLPMPPIALVEVQGYVYDARVRMAALFERFGSPDQAAELRRAAAILRTRIVERFWLEAAGTFALALDNQKRPLPTVATNAGHLLWSRVPAPEQAGSIKDLLLGPRMFSGWGIRTLSAEHRVFNPMSYHNGSIWPHDNAIVVAGLCHYGFTEEALPVVSAMHDAAYHMNAHRLPELFCGMGRAPGMSPVAYPVSCSPQAWASGAFFMMLQAVTGLRPDASARVLHIREPRIPAFLRELTVDGLRVGGSTVALQFQRRGERTLCNLLRVEGEPLQVWIELS